MTISKKIIEEINPYLEGFSICYKQALSDLNNVLDNYPDHIYGRSKATLLHNFVVNEIKKRFDPKHNPSVKILEKHETIKLVINNKLVIRFKKLNQYGYSSNVVTTANDHFIQQQLSFEHPDFKRPVGLEIGYNIEDSWSEFNSIDVVYRKEDAISLYPISITPKEDNITRIKTEDIVIGSRVKVKGKEDKQDDNQESVNARRWSDPRPPSIRSSD